MPYLAPHFEHDVFMSYAHGHAPGASYAPLRSWSQKFIDLLYADFRGLRKDFDDLRFCDDRDVDPTAALTHEIKCKVEKSCILLIMMSPRYLVSDWCTNELGWFKTQFQNRRRSPGRVFVVRAVSTKTDEWPDFLKDEQGHPDIGFQFHPETMEEGIEPYCYPDLLERTREFNQPFTRLRTTLIKRLEEIKASTQQTPESNQPRTPSTATGMFRLYFHAPTSPDVVREEVERDLRADGFRILPGVPRKPGNTIADYQAETAARVQAAQKCDALALLRATDDPSFDDDFLEIGADELARINASRADRPLPCAVLDRSGTHFDLADYARQRGIAVFDLIDPAWRPAFRSWLAGARA
jgi:hypothetical protein